MGVVVALAAAASAAAAGPPECAAASATKYCCAADACVAPHHGSTHNCGTKTDCSAHCGAALTAHQQRTCADGQFARLIGHECHACPEDATTTTANTPAAVATTAPEMEVKLVENADQTTHASTGGTEPQTPPPETSVTRSTQKHQTTTIATERVNYPFQYRITNVDAIDNQWRVAIVKVFSDEACKVEVTDFRIKTLYSASSHSTANMADKSCDTYWESALPPNKPAKEVGQPSYNSEEVDIRVLSTTELKCFQVAHPPGSESQYTPAQFNVYTAENLLQHANVDADESLCPGNPTDDPADDNDGGLTGGEIGGIVGASVGGVVIVGSIVYYVKSKGGENAKFTQLIDTGS
jgi:hypothetical protein